MRNNFVLGLNCQLLLVGPRKWWQTDKPYWKATISPGKQIPNPNWLNTNPNWSVQFSWTDLHHHILTFWFTPSQGWSGIISWAMYLRQVKLLLDVSLFLHHMSGYSQPQFLPQHFIIFWRLLCLDFSKVYIHLEIKETIKISLCS